MLPSSPTVGMDNIQQAPLRYLIFCGFPLLTETLPLRLSLIS